MYSTCECYGCVAQDEQRTELKEGMEIAVRRRRKRSLGNICFLGEMFKLQMLSEAVMHECITRLMKSTWNEESLERFAKLITITGKDLDNEAAKVSNTKRISPKIADSNSSGTCWSMTLLFFKQLHS